MLKTIYSRENRLLLKLLREVRAARGLTQADLAKRMKMRQTDVSKVETGVRRIDFVELRHWLIALDLDMPAFVDEFERQLPSVAALRKT
ncbi:helix-turn-helix transcriptional regulator [Variovorax sp. J31P179]|uniref:helix-turn-helix domain-containing protein n=1 Tax=Variovorax sp. J31P179 TaxID=3053508 RepID=UPI002575B323|nr:helix-turn-helix transcriptional regulator [Variovorax sp. J31P179]MDM0082913.1 helix-turn-helix transcriptional regulator [Variovorax sp. J31P179]